MEYKYTWITYKEAQKLIPLFEWARENAPFPKAQESASRILIDLKNVRNIDYGKVKRHQLIIEERDWQFFQDMRSVGDNEDEGGI